MVPHDMISVAVAALEKSNLRSCPGLWTCIISGDYTPSPPLAFHRYIAHTNVYLSILAHSDTPWYAPPPMDLDFEAELHGLPNAHNTLATDSKSFLARPLRALWHGRGHGVFSKKGPPVRMPLSHAMLEGYIHPPCQCVPA